MDRKDRLQPGKWLPLSVRKRLQRVSANLRGEPGIIIYGHSYEQELPGVPLDSRRGERILAALSREGLVGPGMVLTPGLVSLAKLERVHDAAYLERLHEPETMEAVFGTQPAPGVCERVVEVQRRMTDGTVLAAWAARHQHKLAVNLGGGFHHAHRDRGEGFCLINDIAVAIAQLRARGMDEAIAVIDLDLHDGDGTRSIFADDLSVETFSIHNQHWGPTQARASTSIALGGGLQDEDYLRTLRTQLGPMLDQHRPRLVFYVAGSDPAADDKLGDWNISEAGMLARDRYVIEQLHERGIHAIVWVLAGGYGRDAWRYGARGLIAALGGPASPRLPSNDALDLARYRHLAEIIDPRDLSGVDPDALEFDESDLFGTVPSADLAVASKVLGYYSRDGAEFALERYGLLSRLRKLGFDPHVEIECDAEYGDTIRIYADATTEELVAETRIALDRQTIPGHVLLRIEWLLLQNPRAAWTGGRRPLPGQRHPGLGMFDDMILLMRMTCERLGLGGVVVVPSHYHVASHWHGRMRFAETVAEGRFRALERCLHDLPLAAASRAIELGRVVERGRTEARVYDPAPMLMAVSEALEAHFGQAWSDAAAAIDRTIEFELRES